MSVVLLLLAHGAYLKARNRDGGTCLMLACQSGQLQIARILIAAGSDPTATNTVRVINATDNYCHAIFREVTQLFIWQP